MIIDSRTSTEVIRHVIEKDRERRKEEAKKKRKEEMLQKSIATNTQRLHYERMEKLKMEREIQREQIKQMEQGGEKTADLKAFADVINLPVIDTFKADEVANRMVEYVNICAKYDIKPGLEGICLALGMNKYTFERIMRGEIKREKETKAVFEQIHQFLSAQMEYHMQQGKINPACAIFIAKNNFGYRDQVETIVTKEEKQEVSAEEIRAKYMLEENT